MTAKANWTGVEGVIKMDGSTIAWAAANVKLGRGTASHGRGASESDVYRQGKFDAEGEFTEILTDGVHMGMLMNGTPTTGTAGVVLAATGLSADSINAAAVTIATPSRVKVTCDTAAITTAGTVTIIGTDAGGAPISETLAIPLLGLAETVTGKILFKTTVSVAISGVRSATGKLKFDSIAGTSTVAVGRGALFTYVFGVEDGGNYVRHTWNNCFFTSATTALGDADEMAEVSYGFRPQDPAADCTYAYVNA